MFDDQPINNNNKLPADLPMGEPEDMFAGTEEAEMETMPNVDEESTMPEPEIPKEPTALNAGVLRAKAGGIAEEESNLKPTNNFQKPEEGFLKPIDHTSKPVQNIQTSVKTQQPQEDKEQEYEIKEPGIGRAIMVGAMVVVALVLLVGGGWWLYATFVVDKNAPEQKVEENIPVVEEPVITQEETLPEDILDDQLLFGSAVDSDGDGLDDVRESDIGTDPNNWDTDGDTLSDYDEVTIWKTDPMNSDTDGDTYLDGAEVTSGFSPTGPGRLFDVTNLGTDSGTPIQ